MWIHYVQYRLPTIYILYFERLKTTIKNTDDDTICGNKFITVTHKAHVPHFLPL